MDDDRIATAKDALKQAAQDIDDLQDSIRSINDKIQALEDLGVLEGTEYWKEGKYLTIVEPMRGGQRERHYIGSKAAKVQHALDSVDRWKKRQQLIQDRDTIESKLSRMLLRIDAVTRHTLPLQW